MKIKLGELRSVIEEAYYDHPNVPHDNLEDLLAHACSLLGDAYTIAHDEDVELLIKRAITDASQARNLVSKR